MRYDIYIYVVRRQRVNETLILSTDFRKIGELKFHENPCSETRIFIHARGIRTDRQEADCGLLQFRELA